MTKLAAVAAAFALVAAACGSDSDGAVDAAPYLRAYAGVCAAGTAVSDGDLARARTTFYDQSHQPIHQLAAAAEAKDRGVAGRLLEAKQVVEAELAGQANPQIADFDRLAKAMATAIDTVSDSTTEPCSR